MEVWKWRSLDSNIEALMVFKGRAITANQSTTAKTGMCSDKTRRIVIKPRLLIGSLPILTALLLLPLLRTSTCEEYHILPGDTGKYFRTFERDIKLSIKFEIVGYDRSFSRGCYPKTDAKEIGNAQRLSEESKGKLPNFFFSHTVCASWQTSRRINLNWLAFANYDNLARQRALKFSRGARREKPVGDTPSPPGTFVILHGSNYVILLIPRSLLVVSVSF